MLEIFVKPNEKGLHIFNNANEIFWHVTVKYTNEDKMYGEIGLKALEAQTPLFWEEERVLGDTVVAETLAINHEGVLIQQFSGMDDMGKLKLKSMELIPKKVIVKFVFRNLYSLQAPKSSTVYKSGLVKDFVHLIFTHVHTEYRENETKWDYGQYLYNKKGVHFEQSDGTEILLAKCISLMQLLHLDPEEMADYFCEFTLK
ncbi:MAG: hypothetical protein RR595_02775 [Lysinibacillus sp.]